MANRYTTQVIATVLAGAVVGLAGYNLLSQKLAPLKVEEPEENAIVESCKQNPLAAEYDKLEKQYAVDLSFTDCAFYKHGKGEIARFELFDNPRNSLDVLVIGDSSVAWGLSTDAVSQTSGLKVGAFVYEGMLLTKANMPIYEAIASCVLKEDGRVVLAFTPPNQSQPAADLTTALMQGYRRDLQVMLQSVKSGDFCSKYFAPREAGVIRHINPNGLGLEIISEAGIAYSHRLPGGLQKRQYQIGDKVTFRPAPISGRLQAVSLEYQGEDGDFGLLSGKLESYNDENQQGHIRTDDGKLFFINQKTMVQHGLDLQPDARVEFFAYKFRKNAIAYKVFRPGEQDFANQHGTGKKLAQFLGKMLSFKKWQTFLDERREWLKENWKMDLPNTDFYGYRLEPLVNPDWHRKKNQFDPASQVKIQWGDDSITVYGTAFKETAPVERVKNYFEESKHSHPLKVNAQAVIDWATRQDIVYMLPLSLIGEAKTPLARSIYMSFYKDKLGLIDMHWHFIENRLDPVLMQFGHHPANEGGMVQSLELGRVLKSFVESWQQGKRQLKNTELIPYPLKSD